MKEQHDELAEIMRFQQSLLRLVSQGTKEQQKSRQLESEQTQQLEVWVRRVNPEHREER